jgi:hypothetical protein
MTGTCAAVDQWKEANRHRLIDCRWGCRITPEACLAYQSRASRYVIHFNGDSSPAQRVNAEYVTCFLPDPCPHVTADEHVQSLRSDSGRSVTQDRDRGLQIRKLRLRQQLANPNVMLEEEDWCRSLVTR